MSRAALRVSLQSDGVTLIGDRWDAAEPRGSVVLLHGGGQTRHSWSGTGRRLAARGWNALSLDARGHGESGWAPAGGYTLDALIADLAALVATLPEPPVLVGASMGGTTSLVAQGERGLGRALVLVDIVPLVEPAGVDRILAFMTSAPDGFGSLDEAAAAVRAYNPHRSRPPTVDGLRKNLRLRGDRWHWHWDPAFLGIGSRVRDPERIRHAARAITVPTLLVRGEHSDVVSPAGVADLLELIPHAEYLDVSDTGHMVAGDDNDVFATALLDFLERI
jgi:pimeloyl-ACP methyl ester carboxylesterase